MRYLLKPAEDIRKKLGLTPEEFSAELRMSHATYRAAIKRDYLTEYMAWKISTRFKIPMRHFVGGGK